MTYEIKSVEEFNQKIDSPNDRMILVFYTDSSTDIADLKCSLIHRELDRMGEDISVFRVNLSSISLSTDLLDKYVGTSALVCCVSKAGTIATRYTNPNQPKVRNLILSII